MNIEDAFAISASGMSAQATRLNVISINLANVESTRTAEGGPYRRKDVIFNAAPLKGSFQEALSGGGNASPQGVEVSQIIEDQRPLKQILDPDHPDADAQGYVSYPNVNPLEEMVNMVTALRSYEANVTAFNTTKSMALKTLEIGR